MTAPRLILALSALAFLAFGLAFLVSPAPMAALVHITVLSPTAHTEIRAMYGGLEIGLGVVLLTLLGRQDHVVVGLRVALFAFAGMALGRLAGLVVDGVWQPVMWLLLAIEVAAAALVVWALRSMPAPPPATETTPPT